MKNIHAKIVLLGSSGVGKSSIVQRYLSSSFNTTIYPTLGASFFQDKIEIDGVCVKLEIWDTAGQERFRSMTPMYYRNANAAILVYDITSNFSFEDMKSWMLELQKNVQNIKVLCILGNKLDLQEDRKVKYKEGKHMSDNNNALYFETSAKENTNISEPFISIAKELISSHEELSSFQVLSDSDYLQLTREKFTLGFSPVNKISSWNSYC